MVHSWLDYAAARWSVAALLLLGMLICIDAAFIAIHLVYAYTPWLADPMYSVETDRGYPELFQYIKLAWIILLCLVLAARHRGLTYLAWAATFGALLGDDVFSLHERYGSRLVKAWSLEPMLGLRAVDIGEMLVLGVLGLAVLVVLAVAYVRADAPGRRFTHRVVGLLFVLAFFGVVVDAAGSLFRETALGLVLHTAEDAGEMLLVSVILWTVFTSTETSLARPAPAALPVR